MAGRARAAVPAYLGSGFGEAPPGHRFNLYLTVWDGSWGKVADKPEQAAEAVLLPDVHRRRMEALAARQEALVTGETETVRARSTAPFTTGLGIEHPLENGFAFLQPYGLPYLPGSSVKGVLRAAAWELAEGDFAVPEAPCTLAQREALFGREPGDDDGRRRGALAFRDVHPVLPASRALEWEVMTPHQRAYYQASEPPHDNDGPVPILFLTLPPGTAFTFHVDCNLALLESSDAPELARDVRWREVLRELFGHAFDWLGFGAKTRVGYGAMTLDRDAEEAERASREAAEREEAERARLESLAPEDRLAEEMLKGKTDPSQHDHKYLLERLQAGDVTAADAPVIARKALERLGAVQEQIRAERSGKARKRALGKLEADEAALKKLAER